MSYWAEMREIACRQRHVLLERSCREMGRMAQEHMPTSAIAIVLRRNALETRRDIGPRRSISEIFSAGMPRLSAGHRWVDRRVGA